jgi:DNA topoisomerase-6 subunit B
MQQKLTEAKDVKDVPIAEELAKKQKEVSVAEFFERNRHLLGFDNKRKALLTVVKEAVDNALDACEEARVMPEVNVEVIDMGNDRMRVVVEDNGPGIVKKQIPNIFAKLLYGSKFHTLKQARGQQGIGISAAALYGQMTTGRPIRITSRISENEPAHYFELHIDTQKNRPEIIKEEIVDKFKPAHGTKIELDIEATYQKGDQSVDNYLKETAIVNPHCTIIYTNPKAEQIIFARATEILPAEPKETKRHPYGVEIGMLMKMVKNTESRTMQAFLTSDFARVGAGTAKEICEKAELLPNAKPQDLSPPQIEKLYSGIQQTKIIAPSTDCIVPIGSELLEKGLKKEVDAEFYTSITRSPEVYRGNPFVIECALAYGGNQPKDQPMRLLRFANRVPLLYQQSACAMFKAVLQTNWKPYGLTQSSGALPVGPLTLVIHLASVWPPFTSEAKEAIAHYPEIMKEAKLALQECGRKLSVYVHKKMRVTEETKKRGYIEKYIPHLSLALQELIGLSKAEEVKVEELLKEILEKQRGKLENIEAENEEYDEEFAKIGEAKEGEDDNSAD